MWPSTRQGDSALHNGAVHVAFDVNTGSAPATRCIRSRDPFLVRDGLERRTVRLEHSLGDLLTAHEQSDQGRIRWRRIGDALDDELISLARHGATH